MGLASDASSEGCLQHGGEMGGRMRALDWARTSLGPPAQWPPPLKVAVALCLGSRSPVVIFWGRDCAMLYNDACIPLLGAAKHPAWLGMSGRECLREAWPIVGPMIETVFESGEPAGLENLMLPLDRRVPREECYFSLSFGAIPPSADLKSGPAVPVAGIFCVCTETTDSVLGERRLRMLNELGGGALLAGSEFNAADAAAQTLGASRADLPFMLLYLLDEERCTARLAAVTGLDRGEPAAPVSIDVRAAAGSDLWQLREVMRSGRALLIEHPEHMQAASRPGDASGASSDEPAGRALVLPLAGSGSCFGFLVAGVSTRLVLDHAYRAFLQLVAGHVATGIAAARTIDEERRRVRTFAELARRAHEREREDFHALFMQAPNVFLILRGPQYIVDLANPAACRVLHRAHEEILERPIFEAVPELEGTTFRQMLDEVLRTGSPYQGKEVFSTVLWRGETQPQIQYYNYVFSPLRSVEGHIEGVLVDAFAITDQVIARQEMGRLRAEAESANRMKDQFLAMLGHELRNPLAPMSMALQVMRLRGFASREQDILERQVSHLTRLVDDLLDVSRITRGKIELRRRRLELGEVVASAIETAAPLMKERRHLLEVDVPAEGVAVLGDPERLTQVLLNLLTNAAKYSEAGSRIAVQARRQGERIELCVRDEGMGIAAEMLDKVFDVFVQQPQTLDRAAGGLGLGLSIVRSLVEMHEGTVIARSAGPGKGSEFVIDLPAFDERRAAPEDVTSWSSLVPGAGAER